jgi:hypothetical protein
MPWLDRDNTDDARWIRDEFFAVRKALVKLGR